MSRYFVRLVLIAVAAIVLLGLLVEGLTRSRSTNDQARCQDHLRRLGLEAVRNAVVPRAEVRAAARSDLPPGTFVNPGLEPEQRMSWYAYTLGTIIEGGGNPRQAKPAIGQLLETFDPLATWDAPANRPLATYRLSAAICPAQYREREADDYSPTNYVALGGLGADTPFISRAEAGRKAGAYWFDGPTANDDFKDGLSHTAQIAETTSEIGPWLRGGRTTLRSLDPAAEPYFGVGRAFGGCHREGTFVSMADGSSRFVKYTVDPSVVRAMMTRAGGEADLNLEVP